MGLYRQLKRYCLSVQVWSGSSDGSIAVTDLDSAGKLDVTTARTLKMPTGKGDCCTLQ